VAITLILFEEILYKCSHKATVAVVGQQYGQLLELLFKQRSEKMLRPEMVEHLKTMDMEFMKKLQSIMENSEANRKKSVCGMATIFSEMIANDVRYEKVSGSHREFLFYFHNHDN
jgi:type II secretory pathway predicted ATPase ExeA